MIGNSGIDQEVQAKMDAYRGNPNALAQKYSQNQQLIDLLALQKLKSEKEAAARDMQMKMGGQQMPTIAESREGEVLDLTKQELAQQATGAMQQQQRQKQQAAKQLVEQTAQGGMQGGMQAPMMSGIAGVPAPNMAPKAMATGGIVAFQSGGMPDPVDEAPVYADEELRQRILRGEVPPPAAAAPQGGGNMGSLARQGIMRLLGGESPDQVYARRQKEAAEAAGYTPEEREIIQRQIADRAALDAAKFDPERRRSEGLTRWLLGAGGRTGIGSILGGAGASALNYGTEMDEQERRAMVDRQKQEQGLVDVGPAARMAGMKLGSEAERTAMTGVAQGTGDAVRLEQLQAAAARGGANPEDRRITQAYQALNGSPEIRALIKTRETLSPDDPNVTRINQSIYEIAAPIFRGRGLDPDLFIPRPAAAVEPPPQQPGLGSMIWNALTPSFGGGSTQPAPRPRPSSGGVDPNNPLLRTN